MDSVLIRYHEIALKKGNRAYFTELLKRNVISAVKDLGVKDIRSLPARLLLTLKNDIDQATATERIGAVFGVANFSLVERTPRDMDALRERILDSLDPSTRSPALAGGSCSGFRPTGVLEGATGLPVELHQRRSPHRI